MASANKIPNFPSIKSHDYQLYDNSVLKQQKNRRGRKRIADDDCDSDALDAFYDDTTEA